MATITPEQNRAAREAARISAARRRFERYRNEMRDWGVPVPEIPDTLTAPKLP